MKADRTLVAAVGLGMLLAGCASVPDSRPEGPAGKVAVTSEQAGAVLDRHDEVRSAADAELDAEAIEAVETGPLLEATQTQYRLAEATDEEPPQRSESDNVRPYSPRFAEYPMWFVATATGAGGDDQVTVRVLTRSSPADEWVAEQAAELGGVSLPMIRTEDGAVPEPTDEQTGRVQTVLDEVYAFLADGGGDAEADGDASDEDGDASDGDGDAAGGLGLAEVSGLASYRTWTEESTIQLEEVTAPEVSCRTDDRAEVRVLPTESGVLGVATGLCELRQSLDEDIEGEMTLGGELSALAPEAGREVTFVSSHPLVVTVPDDGPAQVLSGGWRWASVTMS